MYINRGKSLFIYEFIIYFLLKFIFLQIETVICGSSDLLDLDLKELRKHTNYLGIYHDNHPVIEMFWVNYFYFILSIILSYL